MMKRATYEEQNILRYTRVTCDDDSLLLFGDQVQDENENFRLVSLAW